MLLYVFIRAMTDKSAQVRQGLFWWIRLILSMVWGQELLEHYILTFHLPTSLFIYGHNIWPSFFLDLMSCGRLAMHIFFFNERNMSVEISRQLVIIHVHGSRIDGDGREARTVEGSCFVQLCLIIIVTDILLPLR